MVPEIFLTGPLCVEGAGDPLHGLKTVPVHLLEQCLKCDRLQWSSPLSDPPRNKPTNCGDNFKEDSVSSEDSAEPLCLPVWLEGFLYLQVSKKPLHEPSRAPQSWCSKPCSENSSLSQSSQTPSTDEERSRSEGSSVSEDAQAPTLGPPVGLEGCLYVQDIKKPVHALKNTPAKTRNKTSLTTKGVFREDNQGSKSSTVPKHSCSDELERSIQFNKIPLHPSKAAKTQGKKSDLKIDNLRPISLSLSPVEVRPRYPKVFVSGETSGFQSSLPVELEDSIFVQDIKNPLHESRSDDQLKKQNLKCNNLQSVAKTATANSEKQKSKDHIVSGVPRGQPYLPGGLERALYIHDIKKPLQALGRARNGFNKLNLRLDNLLKTPESTNLKAEKKRLRESVVSRGDPAGRRPCVPVKLEETLSVQDIRKPVYQTRLAHSRISKQNLKRDNLGTKAAASKPNKDRQRCKDTLALDVAKTRPPIQLNESLRVQAIRNPLQEAKTTEVPPRSKQQKPNRSNALLASAPSVTRKEKLFLEEDPEEWYRHNIGLERCLNIQPIKNPLRQSATGPACLAKRCLKCDKLLATSRASVVSEKKKVKCKVGAVSVGDVLAGWHCPCARPGAHRHCPESHQAVV